MLGVKGANGIRCCPRCLNVVGLRVNEQESYADTDASGYLVDISCSQLEAFDAARDTDLWRASDMLHAAAGGATRGELAAMETSLGHDSARTPFPGRRCSSPMVRSRRYAHERFDALRIRVGRNGAGGAVLVREGVPARGGAFASNNSPIRRLGWVLPADRWRGQAPSDRTIR